MKGYLISFFFLLLGSSNIVAQTNGKTLFSLLPPKETGINFINGIDEDSAANVLAYEYFYNGGGVAIGDINNDGEVDFAFTNVRL